MYAGCVTVVEYLVAAVDVNAVLLVSNKFHTLYALPVSFVYHVLTVTVALDVEPVAVI